MRIIIKRIKNKWKKQGLAGVLSALKNHFHKGIAWARFGPLSELLSRIFPIVNKPILIISFPRSGSSWVGEIIGTAKSALYLREPITCFYRRKNTEGIIVEVDPNSPPYIYKKYGNRAFSGIPDFPTEVVKFPDDWKLSKRKSSRLVIKEVNPLAIEWFIKSINPSIVILLRHPAAITLSFLSLNWWKNKESSAWFFYGDRIGSVLKILYENILEYRDYKVFFYEDLCRDTVKKFKEMFQYCNLKIDENVMQRIEKTTSCGSINEIYGTERNTREMHSKWRENVSNEQLKQLKSGYMKHNLPWYMDDVYWIIDR